MSREPKCRWDSDHGWLTPEHVRDCDDHACSGCKPCGKSHCGMRGRCSSHVNAAAGIITCGGCVGRVRTDLAAVVELQTVALPDEAEETGVDSEAFDHVGPVALGEHVDYRRGFCEIPRRPDNHAYDVLGRWDLALREQYGPATDLKITVTRAADYLAGLLRGPFPHGDEFEDFAREVAACRAHLESVVHDSRTPERGRPCPRCVEEQGTGPRLRKRYADGADEQTKAGDHDTWHCPSDTGHWWTDRDYRNHVEADFVQHAPELPARELAERVGIPLSTLRKWAAKTWDEESSEWLPPRLVSRKRGEDGRKLYRVADVDTLTSGGA